MATAAARSAERYLLPLPGGPPRAGRVGLRVTVIRICRKASVAQMHGYAQVHICTRNFENGPEP